MRRFLSWLWLVSVIPFVVYHFDEGGRKQIRREQAWHELKEIQALEGQEDVDWLVVMNRYQLLIDEVLPKDEDPLVICQIRLAIGKAQQEALDVGGSIDTLQELLDEVADEYGDDAPITRAVRESLGKSHYMAAWVLKQVKAPEEEWLPHAERARQVFRYLVEHEDPAAFERYEREVLRNVKRMTEE